MPLDRQLERGRDKIVQRSVTLFMAAIDMPLGVVFYLIGGWPLVALECGLFVVTAFAVVIWGACREAAGTTPPRLAAELARAWWHNR